MGSLLPPLGAGKGPQRDREADHPGLEDSSSGGLQSGRRQKAGSGWDPVAPLQRCWPPVWTRRSAAAGWAVISSLVNLGRCGAGDREEEAASRPAAPGQKGVLGAPCKERQGEWPGGERGTYRPELAPTTASGRGGGRRAPPLWPPAWRWGCADLGEAWVGKRLQLQRGARRPHSVGALRGDARPAGAG